MWALHKILSTVLRKPRPTKPFYDGLFKTFLAKLDESTSKNLVRKAVELLSSAENKSSSLKLTQS